MQMSICLSTHPYVQRYIEILSSLLTASKGKPFSFFWFQATSLPHMSTCLLIRISTHIPTCLCTCLHACLHVYKRVCMHVYTHVYMHLPIHMSIRVCSDVLQSRTFRHTCLYMYPGLMHLHTFLCTCPYASVHANMDVALLSLRMPMLSCPYSSQGGTQPELEKVLQITVGFPALVAILPKKKVQFSFGQQYLQLHGRVITKMVTTPQQGREYQGTD